MNELFPNAKALLTWLIGFIGTLLGLLGIVALGFVRNHLKANYVNKEDLEKICGEMTAARERMHEENTGRFETLREDISTGQTETNRRLDALMQNQMRPWR